MKRKTTFKAVRNDYKKIIKVGYSRLQYLLYYMEPFAYSTRAEGWACDYYFIDFKNDIVISTGYAPIGENIDYKIIDKYESAASKIVNSFKPHEEKTEALNSLIEQFIEEVIKND